MAKEFNERVHSFWFCSLNMMDKLSKRRTCNFPKIKEICFIYAHFCYLKISLNFLIGVFLKGLQLAVCRLVFIFELIKGSVICYPSFVVFICTSVYWFNVVYSTGVNVIAVAIPLVGLVILASFFGAAFLYWKR